MLGVWDVHGMLEEMSARQFNEWLEYLQIDPPFSAKLFDQHHAIYASMFANSNRDTKKRSKPYSVEDFTLLAQGKPVKSASATWQEAKMWAMLHNARVEA